MFSTPPICIGPKPFRNLDENDKKNLFQMTVFHGILITVASSNIVGKVAPGRFMFLSLVCVSLSAGYLKKYQTYGNENLCGY
jgi:E3 ubiquitin-protein ligase DOA10